MFRKLLLLVNVATLFTACSTSPNDYPAASLSGTVNATGSPPHTESIDETGQSVPTYVIHAEWPRFETTAAHVEDLNIQAENVAKSEVDSFRASLETLPAVQQSHGSDFRLVYSIEYSTDALVAVRYLIDEYWDGAATSVAIRAP